ncbi:MAG: Peptidoglycan-binding domain 1 protein [Hyphomicrobiales bacterium]|nr:Peptidoglycan-binding domain 1 protein [Hyphomicrobiales bacterium]
MTKLKNSVSRRAFAQGLTIAGLTAAFGLGRFGATEAFAAPADGSAGLFGEQAEWVQKYEGDSRLAVPRSTTPVLSPQTVATTEQAIQQYQDLISRGGWNTVPVQTLKLGSKSAAVVALRKRLTITGDLDEAAGTSPVFDSYVEAGVRRFQARHGISPTGVVAKQTTDALNVPAQVRLRQLEINLVRLRAFSGNLGGRYVTMNIPAAAVETVENGVVATHHAAGVGKIDRQSPVMQAKVVEINFNPFWTVPASIIRKDLIPKMQADPNYLSDNKIRVFNGAGTEVTPQSINWNSMEATQYKFRQDPGGDVNSLGFVRINIPNPHGVYMHDTPAKGIFGDDFRFVSSGCVRVQNVRDYVAWLLKDTSGWDRDHIDEAIRSGQRIDARLSTPVPVYWVYVTAWANDGVVQFREDIYQRDGFGASGAVASARSQPQGGGLLEPMALSE